MENAELNLWDVVYGDSELFEDVTREEITGQSRWTTYKMKIIKRLDDGKLFQVKWGRGSTEQQDGSESEPDMWEVEPYRKMVTKYREVKQ